MFYLKLNNVIEIYESAELTKSTTSNHHPAMTVIKIYLFSKKCNMCSYLMNSIRLSFFNNYTRTKNLNLEYDSSSDQN